MFVVRSTLSTDRPSSSATPDLAVASLLLRPLEGAGELVRFARFADERAARVAEGEPFRLLVEVTGRWMGAPSYAVFAEWQVANHARAAAFEESRRRLFELRRQHLVTFAYDWLLCRLDRDDRYLVLGLYGDEEGLQLARGHPEIQRFAQAHPAGEYTATDVSGMHFFRVEGSPAS